MELLSRFELETSSLPKAQKSLFPAKTMRKIKNWRTVQLLRCQEIAAGGPGPLFFHILQRPPLPDLIPMPRRAYERRNSHGNQHPGLAHPSAGDCMERNQPLTPPCAQGTTTAHLSYRGGPPCLRQLTTPLCQQTPAVLETAGVNVVFSSPCTLYKETSQLSPCHKPYLGQRYHFRRSRW